MIGTSRMTPSSPPQSEQATRLGFWAKPWRRTVLMMIDRYVSARIAEAGANRYRKYAEAKAKLPMDLPPKEYEDAIKRLAKKYKI